MKLSPTWKKVIGIAAAIILIGVASFAYGVYGLARQLLVDESIVHAYEPVVSALYKFQDEHKMPAENLPVLTPQYLPQILNSKYVASIKYQILEDGKEWQFLAYSNTLNHAVYCYRSNQKYTPQEDNSMITRFSGWTVFKPEDVH